LRRVVGVAGRPGDATGDRVDAVVVPSEELIEREAVTSSRSFDQLVVIGLDGDAASVTNGGAPRPPY